MILTETWEKYIKENDADFVYFVEASALPADICDEYLCAVLFGKVLTTAPFATVDYEIKDPQCGDCRVCADVCPTNALRGTTWRMGITRDEMLIRKQCTCCLKCMIYCPYTRKYAEI